MNYQITTTIIGLCMAAAILYLVRRDHLHGPYALWWLGVAVATAVFGLEPSLFDRIAKTVGVNYPPSLLFALVIGLMLLKLLKGDIERSRHERKLRRIAQHLAIVAEENRRLREVIDDQHGGERAPRAASR